MRLLFFIIVFQSVWCTQTLAQQLADTLDLGEVEVQASRIYVADRYQPVAISFIDSVQLENHTLGNISELLDSFAPVYIRTNGPGGVATLSQRGYSPSQTQVLWNSFQLNHAMLGLTDLSLIPSYAVQQVNIASGNGNTSFGDKGGGTVALSLREPDDEIGFSQSLGSFGQSISESYGGLEFGNWSVSLITGQEISENNFTYTTREFSSEAGGFVEVEKERTNNEQNSKTGILSLNWEKDHREFSTMLWAHDMTNQVPGSITGLTPNAYQEDAFFRWMSRYSTRFNNHRISSKIYLNRQQLDFLNPSANINSLSTSSALIGDLEVRSSFSRNFQLISALQFGQNWVEATDYTGSPRRSQLTAQLNPVWRLFDPVHLYGGLRLDYYSDFGDAFSANLGMNVELLQDHLFLKGQLSRNFVAPTFNDMYWPDLGNPDLNPETNIKYEVGLLYEEGSELIHNKIEATFYDGRVKDGIRWLPGSDGRSRPLNLENLRLWGFEVSEELAVNLNEGNVGVRGVLLYSLAEITTPRFQGDRAVGKQLRYTPKWQFKSSAFIGWKEFNTSFTYNFTDERFSTADHSSPFDPMPSYQRASWSGSYNFTLKQFQFIPRISLQNLFDESYSVVSGYPMPGRSWQTSLTIKYKFN